jgi:predicted NUDIX family NTP pyrophosphohydrolase
MPPVSAGLLMVRGHVHAPEFFLAHPGGPFFRSRDVGAWTIPKGMVNPGEDLLAAARREFEEETSVVLTTDSFISLGHVRQGSGKIVHAWAFAGDCDPAAIRSNTCEMEWPPRSGRRVIFPEIDRAAFYDLATARRKILPAQSPFIDRALAAAARLLP